jgi:hypothetical protein
MVKLDRTYRFGVTDERILWCILAPNISCKSKDGKSWRKFKPIVTALPPGVEGWLDKASVLFYTGIGSFNPPTMDMSRMVLGRMLVQCQLSAVFLLPIYYKHSRGNSSSETVAGHEPMFLVVAEKQIVNKRDLLVSGWNAFMQPPKIVNWYEGFACEYYTWQYKFYSTLRDSDCIPDWEFLFTRRSHIKLEGVDSGVSISTLIKAVGERVVDPSMIGHVFIRGVRDKNYMEAFICVHSETYIDVSQETLNALNIAHQSMLVRGAVEHCLTGKNDIEWYSLHKPVTAGSDNVGTGTSTILGPSGYNVGTGTTTALAPTGSSGTTGPGTSGPSRTGRIPGGRGGGRAVGRRVSPLKDTVTLMSSWKEVAAIGNDQEIRSLQDQIKLLTDKVSSLKLRK